MPKNLPITFKSRAISGALPDIDRDLFKYILEQCEGKPLTITIDHYVRKRTNAQNSYYWPVIVEYVLEGLIDAGYRRETLSPELVHDFLKGKFLKHMKKRTVNPVTRQYLTHQPTTQQLTTWQFMDYVEGIVIWAAEFLNVAIPPPNKEWKEQAEKEFQEALKIGLITQDERNRVRISLKLQNA